MDTLKKIHGAATGFMALILICIFVNYIFPKDGQHGSPLCTHKFMVIAIDARNVDFSCYHLSTQTTIPAVIATDHFDFWVKDHAGKYKVGESIYLSPIEP